MNLKSHFEWVKISVLKTLLNILEALVSTLQPLSYCPNRPLEDSHKEALIADKFRKDLLDNERKVLPKQSGELESKDLYVHEKGHLEHKRSPQI